MIKVVHVIHATNPKNLFVSVMKLVTGPFSYKFKDDWGTTSRGVDDVVIEVYQPAINFDYSVSESFNVPGVFWSSVDRLDAYNQQLDDGGDNGFSYTYRNRWSGYFGIDQFEEAITRLKRNISTRRAVVATLDPSQDLIVDKINPQTNKPTKPSEESIPCIMALQFIYDIRTDTIKCLVYMRSSDGRGALVANIVGVASILNYVSDEIGKKPGDITFHIGSLHYYPDSV